MSDYRGRGRSAHRQTQMLDFVRRTIEAEGIAPSYAMICNALGVRTRQEVSRMVQAAERAGKLRRVGAGKVRRIRIAAELC